MNLSDPSDDDSSSDGSPRPAKRVRADTYGASSTTSHGSVLQESDKEMVDTVSADIFDAEYTPSNKPRLGYDEQSTDDNMRLSRSSLSENCSSPNDQCDDDKLQLEVGENGDGSMRPNFKVHIEECHNKNLDKVEYTGYSESAKRMMKSMGFQPGKGLGKFEHGRIQPVEAASQKGRRGLGAKPSVVGELPQDLKATTEELKPEAKEEVMWLDTPPDEPPSGDVLEKWLKRGPRKMTIDDETEFVELSVLKGVLDAKNIFDSLDDEDLRHARFRSNPYETIGAAIFLNRAAVKMANIDAVFDFNFTNPKKPNGEDAVDSKDLLYFADVCAGPGGFSEYVLYRKGWRAKGFGFTLRSSNDFKLGDFHAGPSETFNPYYGINGDGNIFDPANLNSLKQHVLTQTDDLGVHSLMGDGGFSVEGQENLQEILSKQLYLCQCLAGLMLVRTGGNFVVKLFDIFTAFSVGLVYLMYRCFNKVCIFKPVTSRPANSERYLVCLWKKMNTEPVEQYLSSVNCILWDGEEFGGDVVEIVPLDVIKEDKAFYRYIYKSNSLLGEKQIQGLLKIARYSKNKHIKDEYQGEMKKQCLELWKLPDAVRTQADRLSPDDALAVIITLMKKPPIDTNKLFTFKSEILNKPPEYLEDSSNMKNIFKNVYDWHLMFLSSGKNSPDLRIFVACGGKRVFQLEPNGWRPVIDLNVLLPAKTLIYGEVVKEYLGEGTNQRYSKSLHIIDALMLGGVDVSDYSLTDRIYQCNLFCTALKKPFDKQAVPVRCKRLYNMEQIESAMCNLEYRAMKRIKKAVTIDSPDRNRSGTFYTIGSVLFLKQIKEPWIAQISKSSGHKYYFSFGQDGQRHSLYHIPSQARMDMINSFTRRVIWPWEPSASAIFDGHTQDGLSRPDLEKYVSSVTS